MQFKINEVNNRSILVHAELVAEILVASGVAGAASSLLTNILTQRIYTKTEERQYKELVNKLKVISKYYSERTSIEFHQKQKFTAFISPPKNQETVIRDFYFDPVDFDEARENLKDAINRYHNGTGKV